MFFVFVLFAFAYEAHMMPDLAHLTHSDTIAEYPDKKKTEEKIRRGDMGLSNLSYKQILTCKT